jgi:hypothetical protein
MTEQPYIGNVAPQIDVEFRQPPTVAEILDRIEGYAEDIVELARGINAGWIHGHAHRIIESVRLARRRLSDG